MSVTYYTAAGQPAFNVVTTIGLPVWERPFEDTAARLVFRQRFMQAAVSYTPITLNTAYPAHGQYGVPTSTSFYLVGEENFSDEKAGMLQWDRVYAAVPSTRYDYTSIAYPYPGMVARPVVTGSYTNITGFGYGGVDRLYIATDGSVTFSRGDWASVSFRAVVSASTVQFNSLALVRDVGTTGGAVIDLVPNFFDSSITVTRQVARAVATAGRASAQNMVGRAVIQYDYAMITPSVTPVFTFASRQTFTKAGEEVDYVDSQTSPSLSTYQGWVGAGTFFNAEDDTWSRWRGNIYEKRSTRIVAL